MPNLYAPYGIPPDFEEAIVLRYKCQKCGVAKLRPVAFVRGSNNSAFLYQCRDCYEHVPFVFAKEPLSSPDIAINIVNSLGDLNRQIQQEPSRGTCPKCKDGTYRSVEVSKCNRMALDIVECDSCGFSVPIISIVRSTLFAYSYDIQLGRKVATEFPEIALVFCVAALETYFRQLFQYHSELNEYLVRKRRVNFQSLDETKTVFKKEFGINIVELIEKDWVFLCEKFQMRHRVIHHASYDANGKKIDLSQQEIEKLFSVVDDLVYKMEMALLSNDIVI